MSTFLKTVKELARSWYAVDRIRIPPATGRLLQLNVGNSILIRNELYTVQERKISDDDGRGQVAFRLGYSEGEAILTVWFNEDNGGEGRLTINGESSIVFDCDVVVRQLPGSMSFCDVRCPESN